MRAGWNILIGAGLVAAQWAAFAPAMAADPIVQRVEVVGAQSIAVPLLESLAEPYLDRVITRNDLQALADELSSACQNAGSFLCRADIPRQDLSGGALQIAMSEGFVAEIKADDDVAPLVRRAFRKLLVQRPAEVSAFRQGVAELKDIPGLKVRGVRATRLEGDAYVLEVEANYKRVSATVAATNRGSRRDHPWKTYLHTELRSAFAPGDALKMSYLTRPQAADELAFARVRYESMTLQSGLRAFVDVAGSNTAPSSRLSGRDVEGELVRGKVGVRLPVLRGATRTLNAEARIEASQSIEQESGETLYRDDLRVLRVALRGRQRWGDRASLRGMAAVSQGLDMFGAGGASRPDGEATFTAFAFEMNGEVVGPGDARARAGVEGQLAFTPLLFAEEYSFGGGRYGRAYDFGEVLGERGIASYVELARPYAATEELQFEPYFYSDVGGAWNEGAGLSADGRMLWSAGGGLRVMTASGWALSYEAAEPLSDAPYTIDDESIRHRVDVGFQR